MSTKTTTEQPPQMLLLHWMYHQIIHDESVKAVWCFCGAPALSYCNGLQFVCHGDIKRDAEQNLHLVFEADSVAQEILDALNANEPAREE